MQKLKFINSLGEELDFTDGINYGVVEWNGLSEVDLNVQSQQVPFKDGAVYIDSLYSQRELSFTVAMNDEKSLAKRYTLKRDVISKMNSKLGEGYLYYRNDILEKRIKVIAQAPIFPTKNFDEAGTLKFSISFTACNPYWEDIEESTFAIGKGINELEITGDVDTEVDLYIEAIGANNLVIENETTGKKLIFPEIEDNFKMNLNTGSKSIKKTTKVYDTFDYDNLLNEGEKIVDYFKFNNVEYFYIIEQGDYRPTKLYAYKDGEVYRYFEWRPSYSGYDVIGFFTFNNELYVYTTSGFGGKCNFYKTKDGINFEKIDTPVTEIAKIDDNTKFSNVSIFQGYFIFSYREFYEDEDYKNVHIYRSKDFQTYEEIYACSDYIGYTYCLGQNGNYLYIKVGSNSGKFLKINANFEVELISFETSSVFHIFYQGIVYGLNYLASSSGGSIFKGSTKFDLINKTWEQYPSEELEFMNGIVELWRFKSALNGKCYFISQFDNKLYECSDLTTNDWVLSDDNFEDEQGYVVNTENINLVYAGFNKIKKEDYKLTDVNLLQTLSPNSDMDFKLKKGNNVIKVTTDTGNVGGVITYRNKFVGV